MNKDYTTDANGITLNQWIVREGIRLQSEADRLWNAMDDLQPIEDFLTIRAEYEAICDTMDELEINPEQLFNKR